MNSAPEPSTEKTPSCHRTWPAAQAAGRDAIGKPPVAGTDVCLVTQKIAPAPLSTPHIRTKQWTRVRRVHLAAVLEHLVAEVLELAGNAAKLEASDEHASSCRITPQHIFLGMRADPEMHSLVTASSDGEAYQDELIGDAPSITNHATPSADCCEAKAHNARTGWGTQGAFREPLRIFHRGGLDRVWKTQISKCPPDAHVMMYDAAAARYSTQTATAIKHLKEFLAIDGLEEHTRRQRHNEGEAQQQLDHFDAEAERHQAIQEAMLRVVDVLLSLQRPNGTLAAEMLMMEADMRPWSQEGLSGVKGAIKASKFGSVQDIEQKLSDMLQDLEEYDCKLQEDDEDYEAQDKVFYLSRRHQTHDDSIPSELQLRTRLL